MATLGIAFPILPGKGEELKRLGQELAGARRDELVQTNRRLGLRTENWYLQSTPMGQMVIVYLEGDDPVRSFQDLASSQTPFHTWFKEQVQAISGIDFNQPPPAYPEQVLEWKE